MQAFFGEIKAYAFDLFIRINTRNVTAVFIDQKHLAGHKIYSFVAQKICFCSAECNFQGVAPAGFLIFKIPDRRTNNMVFVRRQFIKGSILPQPVDIIFRYMKLLFHRSKLQKSPLHHKAGFVP